MGSKGTFRKPYIGADTLPGNKGKPMDKQMFNFVLNENGELSEVAQNPPTGTLSGNAADVMKQSEFKKPYARDSKGYQKMEHAVWNPPYNIYPNHGGRGYGSYPSLLGYGETNEPNPLRGVDSGEPLIEWKYGPYVCRGPVGGLYTDTVFVGGSAEAVVDVSYPTGGSPFGSAVPEYSLQILSGKGTDTAQILLSHADAVEQNNPDGKFKFYVHVRLNTGEVQKIPQYAKLSPWL